jgi:hypothetical protein
LNYAALHRRLEFKENYVYERHDYGSWKEGGRRIILMVGVSEVEVEDKLRRTSYDDLMIIKSLHTSIVIFGG